MPEDDARPVIRIVERPDDEAFLALEALVWAKSPHLLAPETTLLSLPPDRRFAAVTDPGGSNHPDRPPDDAAAAAYLGIYGVYPLTLGVPGPGATVRPLPVAGLTWVGVHPDHRRRGLLTAMVRHHLEWTRGQGLAISALHASEPGIYGRFGYGAAVTSRSVTLARGTSLHAPDLDGAAAEVETQLTTITDPGTAERLRAVDQASGAVQVGALVFEPSVYERICLEPATAHDAQEPRRVLFARRDGHDVGVAVLRRVQRWQDGRPAGRAAVSFRGGQPAERLALLRRLVDLDLIASTTVSLVGDDDPLWHWVRGPRGADSGDAGDNLWLRLVDLPAAFAARGYSADCDVVLEVTDAVLPDNAGRWHLAVRGGQARLERADGDPDLAPDLALDVAVLGAAWLGSANLAAMTRAGLVSEHRPGAGGELWRALRTDVAAIPAPIF
jgi:predicted acetyltransferase